MRRLAARRTRPPPARGPRHPCGRRRPGSSPRVEIAWASAHGVAHRHEEPVRPCSTTWRQPAHVGGHDRKRHRGRLHRHAREALPVRRRARTRPSPSTASRCRRDARRTRRRALACRVEDRRVRARRACRGPRRRRPRAGSASGRARPSPRTARGSPSRPRADRRRRRRSCRRRAPIDGTRRSARLGREAGDVEPGEVDAVAEQPRVLREVQPLHQREVLGVLHELGVGDSERRSPRAP